MIAYLIATVNVTDPEKYKGYMARTPAAIAQYGGKFIVRGGNLEVLEGDWKQPRVVVLEFPSRELAKQFFDSAEYAEARKHREDAAEFTAILLDGVE